MRPDLQNYSEISKQRLQTVERNKSNVEKKQTRAQMGKLKKITKDCKLNAETVAHIFKFVWISIKNTVK